MSARARWGLLCLFSTSALAAGSSAQLEGTVEVRRGAEDGGTRAKQDRSDVVVYLTGWESPPRELTHKMDQVEKTFVPRVLPIVKGEKVVFTNGDPLLHNVFSHSRAKEFDLGKNRQGEAQSLKFEKTGVVDVYCDIHESMSASILVLPNKAFARTGPDGAFRIEGIPPGSYVAYAWLHGSEPAVQKVTFAAGEKKSLTFQLVEAGQEGNHVDKHGRPYKQRQTY